MRRVGGKTAGAEGGPGYRSIGGGCKFLSDVGSRLGTRRNGRDREECLME